MWHVSRTLRTALYLALMTLSAPALALAETVTLDFDAPEYLVGDSVGTVGDVTIWPAGTVFAPTNVATFSGTQALRSSGSCTSATCSNGAYFLTFRFGSPLPMTNNGFLYRPAARVSVRVGVSSVAQSCFPENNSCAMYASVAAFDRDGNPVVPPQDVFLFDASMPSTLPITREISVVDPLARIARVSLSYGKGTVSHDIGFPGEPQIDHLVVEFPDAPPPTGPTPAPPTIQITEPSGTAPRVAPYNVNLRGSVTAPGGIGAFCYRLNAAVPIGSACTQLSLLRPDNTFDIGVPDHQLAAGANTLSVTVYDLQGQVTTRTATVTTQAPPPPVVIASSPAANQWLDPSRTTNVTGTVRTVGALKGFCLRIDAPAFPAPGTCIQDLAAVNSSNYAYQPLSFNASIAPNRITAGAHTISLFAVDRWDQVGRADIAVNAPTDLRVVAMEITQGVQTFDLPINQSGSAPYAGVNLRQGVPTVVRVFANSPYAGSYSGASMLLRGFAPDPPYGETPLGVVLPDSSPASLGTGPLSVPVDVRHDPGGGFVFTLPTSWTLTQGLRLQAALIRPLGLQECAGCTTNNEFSVTNINFGPAVSVTVSPVSLTFTDAMGVFNAPPPPAGLFAPAANIAPVPPSQFVVRPFVGTVDISAWVGPGGACRAMNSICQPAVHMLVTQFELLSPQPGYTIGVGPADIGLDSIQFLFRPWKGVFDVEHIAIANSGRIMLAVAHELYHMMGYFHASPCGDSDLWNLWPPDQKGFIHGVGLNRTRTLDPMGNWNGQYAVLVPGSQSLPGGTANYYDLMSYCASESTAWISVENWNSFGGAFPNGLLPDQLVLGEATTTINTGSGSSPEKALEVEGGVMRASAALDAEGQVQLMRVHRAGRWLYEPTVKGEYEFVVRDARSRELARLPATVAALQGQEDARSGVLASAFLPAKDAASIELEHRGEVVAWVESSRSAPKLELLPLEAGVLSADESLELRWKAGDADGDPLEARIDFSPGPDQPFRAVYLGPDRGRWTVPGRLFNATDKGRVRVVISDGFHEVEQELGPFVVHAGAPLLEIQGLAEGASFPQSTPIRVQASAFGDGQMPLASADIHWTLDGRELGSGAEIELRDLEPGEHLVQVVAREGKLESTREVMFQVRTTEP